mmetsp:Transcript_18489/g.37403  ORF Transcript_18489/g.37403 Transcript_18489/m.37403 type:complete len:103 (-) Transcript_18489:809-1117(-)
MQLIFLSSSESMYRDSAGGFQQQEEGEKFKPDRARIWRVRKKSERRKEGLKALLLTQSVVCVVIFFAQSLVCLCRARCPGFAAVHFFGLVRDRERSGSGGVG